MTPDTQLSLFRRLVGGHFGLALTYWTLFLVVAVLFFIFGSLAVSQGHWARYTVMLMGTVVWSFVLLVGIDRAYRGEDPGKALGRIAMLFLLLNLSNALATLSFIQAGTL